METFKIKDLFKYFLFMAMLIIISSVVLRMLVYAVPAAFIIWAGYRGWKKLMGMVHEHRKQFKEEDIYGSISKDNGVKDTFDAFNSRGVNIVDVEYEEVD